MKPEAQEAETPKRLAQRQHGLLRAQAVEWAGVGDGLTVGDSLTSNFVMGANKAASQTYSAASILSNVK